MKKITLDVVYIDRAKGQSAFESRQNVAQRNSSLIVYTIISAL